MDGYIVIFLLVFWLIAMLQYAYFMGAGNWRSLKIMAIVDLVFWIPLWIFTLWAAGIIQ